MQTKILFELREREEAGQACALCVGTCKNPVVMTCLLPGHSHSQKGLNVAPGYSVVQKCCYCLLKHVGLGELQTP